MAPKNPIHPEEITPEWITFALSEGGHIKECRAVSIDKKVLGEGVGLLSSVVRVGIEYDLIEQGAPESVVVKIEPEADWSKEFNEELSSFQREIRFYREVASNAPIQFPKFYYAVDEPPAYSLVLEDLSYYTPGDQLVGMHQSQVMDTVEVVAKLQAKYWNNNNLEKLAWMPRRNGVSNDFTEKWPLFLENFGHLLNKEAVELGDRLVKHVDWKNKEIEKRPLTVVHADLREDNLLFPPAGSGKPVLILDWQLTTRNIGAADVARIMGGSEIPKERKGHHFEVLRKWYDTLIKEGVADYTWDDAVYDFRLGTLSYLCFPVHFCKAGIGATGRLKELLDTVYNRAFSSAVDIDAGSVLPE